MTKNVYKNENIMKLNEIDDDLKVVALSSIDIIEAHY